VSVFQDDFAAVADMFIEAFGVSVVYVIPASSGDTEIELTARVSLQSHTGINGYGITETIVSRDYLVTAADLSVTPEAGHYIRETIAEEVRSFELMAMENAPCYEPADADYRELVLHTKEVT